MMNFKKQIVICGVSLLCTVAAHSAESLSVLLQKGIFAEETEGNLDAAIKIYEDILKETEANRSLVAQAQYRLGVCQLKRGKKDEAVTQFRRLIDLFPKETELVTKTRERLTELGQPASSVVVRQVWSPALDTSGSVSRDGRWLSFVDWETGDLAIRDLVAERNRRLTDKGPWHKSSEFAEYSVISPDGKQVAYNWFNGKDHYELWRISLEDPQDRVRLLAKVDWVWPLDWSPDGQSIAAEISYDRGNDLALVSAHDGSIKTLKALAHEEPDSARFSPDGRYLSYSIAPVPGRENDIYLIELKTGVEMPLITHPADDKAPIWTSDGTGLLFTSDRRGTVDLWFVPVANGKITGEPVFLKTDFNDARPMGFTRSGALHYGLFSRSSSLYVASLDLETGKLISQPKPVPLRLSGGSREQWSLSPNGRFLSYAHGGRNTHQHRVHFVDLESGQDQEITNLPRLRWNERAGTWWRTDESLFVWGTTPDRRESYSLFDRMTAQVQTVVTPESTPDTKFFSADFIDGKFHYLRWNPPAPEVHEVWQDPKTNKKEEAIVFSEPDPKAKLAIRYNRANKLLEYTRGIPQGTNWTWIAGLHEPVTGRDFELVRIASDRMSFCSPMHETRRVAITAGAPIQGPSVKVFDITGDRPVERLSLRLPELSLVVPGWDSKRRLLFTKRVGPLSEDQDIELWSVSVETGEMKNLDMIMPRLNVVAMHPDGKQVFFQKHDKPLSQVWVMENFLPPLAAAK